MLLTHSYLLFCIQISIYLEFNNYTKMTIISKKSASQCKQISYNDNSYSYKHCMLYFVIFFSYYQLFLNTLCKYGVLLMLTQTKSTDGIDVYQNKEMFY